MLLLTILPICVIVKEDFCLHVSKGGTDTRNAPTVNYLRFVLLPVLKRIGFDASVTVHKYGYYPKGMGEVTMTVKPCRKLTPFRLEEFGTVKSVKGVSVCTYLARRKVARRQADSANEYLAEKGYAADIQVVNDTSNPLQKGSSIALWAETEMGVVLGADAIGELGKPSEAVGREAAEKLCSELYAKPTVDTHLSDMLIPYATLTEGSSVFLARRLSEHLETNIWLAEKMSDARFKVEKTNGLFRVKKLG